ncbi:MAG: hypothetical protein KAT15_26205, partial [Bacteroidales bacterium]|nr:hypothetical protein [Bacteroidales bacterium]
MTRVSRLIFPLFLLAFSLFFTTPVAGEGGEHEAGHSAEGLMRGERLFYGLVEGKFENRACANCHNTVEIDTFNWNPNAWEIAHKYKLKSLEEFQKAVLNPVSKTMSVMHQTFNLNESDVELIKLWSDNFEEHGLEKQKPVINKIFLFL